MIAATAVVPVKEIAAAKQRLAPVLDTDLRRALALAMLADVLDALAAGPSLPVVVATVDPEAMEVASGFGASVSRADAVLGHSEAVSAAARALAREGRAMLTLPADIPLVAAKDIARILGAAEDGAKFVIVPARDGLGSNAVLCNPADIVPLSFGGASCHRNCAAARARGLTPRTLVLPRVGLDLDTGDDLADFVAIPSCTRARALLQRHGIARALAAEAQA
ncbi:MAG: 2-phospho-L-lactate guanylyltransferase [Stellaceae bacterium]